jgi:hypothetical protein
VGKVLTIGRISMNQGTIAGEIIVQVDDDDDV